MAGFFGGGNKVRDNAITVITEYLQLQLVVYTQYGNLVEIIRQDAYMAGCINGKLLTYISYFIHVEGMPAADANRVSGMVLLNLFGEDQAFVVSQAIKNYSARNSPQFLDGQNKGHLIINYALGAQDVQRDPNYEIAIASFRETERISGSGAKLNNKDAAAVGLEQIWFWEYLAEYWGGT